ncbi:porin [Cupriavidus taiwanensis]|uniref:Putative outer membrane porin n=1 Tax=Cupriavidus taiwanensis TaxID=164546 RepID=A0A375J888_9BURK|nr:porin [Cupriavidus taiwanensis]SPS01395.1 putative outer membrane porin [Cupriavidus taiwanensis]
MSQTLRLAAGLAFPALLGLPTAAMAQSGVTLYGVIDTALTYQTHSNPAGDAQVGLQQGGEGFLSGSRFGLKGVEDLGGGVKAGFVLENGLLADTGRLDQQGQLFGRQAYVKIGNRWGELALGRQYTTANTMLYYVDPLGVGAAPSNAWMVYLTGQRYDNAVSYTGNFGPVSVIAEYALGETAGNTRAMSSMSFGVKYAAGPITAVGDFQQTRDSQSRNANIYLAGLKAAVGRASLFANYIHSDRDAGFDSSKGGTDTATITSMSTAATPTNRAAISSVFGGSRHDDFFTLGASYAVTGNVTLTGSVMHNRTRADNFSGNRTTAYAVAGYAFSKRTDAYLALAYDRVHGDWSGLFGNNTTSWTGGSGTPLDGHDTQTTVMVGLRHQF